MKLLIVAESVANAMGGGRTGILGICEALALQGVDVTLFTSTLGENDFIGSKSKIYTNQNGFNIVYFPFLFSFMGTVLSFGFLFKLYSSVRFYDLVLIHSIYKVNSTFAAFCCRFFSIPYILRPHGSFDAYLINRRRSFIKRVYIKFFELKSIKYAEVVQFSSDLEKKQTFEQIGFISNAIVIPEGINLNSFIKPAQLINNSNAKDYFRILYLGRLHNKKGIEILIDAVSILSKKYQIKLVLAGSGDPAYEKLLSDKVFAHKLQDSISFAGYLSETGKLEYLYSSDVFVLASYGENFGLSLVEAMACSLPVVTTVGVGISPEISSANAGVVTECDSISFARGLETMIANPELRLIMSKNARQLVCDKFSNDKMGSNLICAYKTIIDGYKF